ncbi:hypothetical protein [Streptomyces sp. enrichment culture]|uniref:hypothetical protein n=1 Tax=Streptomyces sp. enrichment culture TaxID=1795815 RepID=UPI003F547D5D
MRRWGPPVAVHLILGVVALVPLWLSMMFLVSHPLAAWGLTSPEPTDNDGALPWLVLLVPMWAVFLALWLPLGSLARRTATGVSRARYWTVGAALVLAPMVFLTTLFYVVEG